MPMPELLPCIEIETAPQPQFSVIWLHGLGADGNDFVPVLPELGLPAGLAVRFIFPHAPLQAVTCNNGYVMRAWYDTVKTSGALPASGSSWPVFPRAGRWLNRGVRYLHEFKRGFFGVLNMG